MSNITTTNICAAIEVVTILGFMTDNLHDVQAVMLVSHTTSRSIDDYIVMMICLEVLSP